MIFTNLIKTNLRTKTFGRRIEYYQRLESTNKEAWELIDADKAENGMIVITDHQFSGKGRNSNKWYMSPSKGLAMSIIILESLDISKAQLIPLAAGLAVAKALTNRGSNPKLKWPNDILVNKQKIAGILIQNKLKGNYITHSVIGLGLNVNQLVFEVFSPLATSLRLQLSNVYDVSNIQSQFLSFLFERLKRLKAGENQENEYLKVLFLKDKLAAFESNNKQFMGIIKGVSESGALLVQLENDSIYVFENQQIKYLF